MERLSRFFSLEITFLSMAPLKLMIFFTLEAAKLFVSRLAVHEAALIRF